MRLSIITLGHVHAEELTALTPHFERIEQLVLDVPPRDDARRSIARSSTAPSTPRRTTGCSSCASARSVDEALAREIADAGDARARRGLPHPHDPALRRQAAAHRRPGGELRLLHRRYCCAAASSRAGDGGAAGEFIAVVTFASSRSIASISRRTACRIRAAARAAVRALRRRHPRARREHAALSVDRGGFRHELTARVTPSWA
jgi:hypothetical protein